MGAFASNPGDVQDLVRAGVPVWFIRPVISINREAAKTVLVSMRAPTATDIELRLWQTNAPAIYSGLSGHRHLEVICGIKHMYIEVSQSPLLYRYDYASQPSSSSSGPSRSGPRQAVVTATSRVGQKADSSKSGTSTSFASMTTRSHKFC